MVYLNLTDVDSSNITRIDAKHGQQYNIPDRMDYSIGYSNIKSSISFGDYLDLNTTDKNRTYNPFAVSESEFLAATMSCGGTASSSSPNINSTLIGCGLVYGAASRTDGGDDLINDPLSRWTIPMYSCASAIKASVKTAEFEFNGTGFAAVTVQSVQPKTYPDPSSIPIRGVEDVYGHTMEIVQPLWGIIGPNSTGHEDTIEQFNITTHTKESLYLPGYINFDYGVANSQGAVPDSSGQNLPGSQFFNQALYLAYSIDRPVYQQYADYSGMTSRAMYAKWQRLAQSAEGAASIINLVWTDISANSVVGTRGWGLHAAQSGMSIPTANTDSAESAFSADTASARPSVPVTVYESHIRYRVPFAVPAFIVLGATLVILATLVVLLVMKRMSLVRLRVFLESTSVGRILWPYLQAQETTRETDESVRWVKTVGARKVTITSDSITAKSTVLENMGLLNGSHEEKREDAGKT